MTRAPKICSARGCPNVAPCEEHTKKPWAGSGRASGTLSGSAQQKRSKRILARDQYICHVCGGFGADEADHVKPLGEGGPDTDENMAAIHREPCHREKTAEEAARARS